LLNSNDCDVLLAELLSFGDEVVVNLAGAKYYLSYVRWFDVVVSFTDDSLEVVTLGELLDF